MQALDLLIVSQSLYYFVSPRGKAPVSRFRA
jgi:hypothetical protein